MVSFKKLLLTTDLSTNAEAAVPYALDLARQFKSEVLLTYTFEDHYYYAPIVGTEPILIATEWYDSIRKQHKAKFEQYATVLMGTAQDVSIRPCFLMGIAVDRILELAKKENVDLIVISTHGRTGLQHLFYGSVAEKIVRLSPHPVLTVRPQA